jgi:hypothetical protein
MEGIYSYTPEMDVSSLHTFTATLWLYYYYYFMTEIKLYVVEQVEMK